MFRVEYIRDGLIEEWHEGSIAFFPGGRGKWKGKCRGKCGDKWSKCVNLQSEDDSSDVPFYLRSCAKPLQATLLIDYGLDFTPEELAFCCGSHSGEKCHIEIAQGILKKIGLDESFLKCGIHAPLSRTTQDEMHIAGEKPRAIHNNCSGKHIGFLAVCKKAGWDLSSYDEPNHPLQIAVKNKINELCEVTKNYPVTTDGCGVPILSMPLVNMVKGFVNLNKKYPQIVSAIKNNPYIFGGENRTDTKIIQSTNDLIAKVGAGGLCVVLNYKTNEGFGLKINDSSMEGREIALFEIINRLNWGNIKYDKKIKTLQGKIVGEIRVKIPQ